MHRPSRSSADAAARSGSDVVVVAKEAAMRPLRRLLAMLEGDGAPAAAVGGKAEVGTGQAPAAGCHQQCCRQGCTPLPL